MAELLGELCITHFSLKRMGFSSVPRLPGWSFQQLICGGVLPPPHCPGESGPAVSPTDKLRKDSALTPVTSEKSTLFIGVTKIVRFCKALLDVTKLLCSSACPVKCLPSGIPLCGPPLEDSIGRAYFSGVWVCGSCILNLQFFDVFRRPLIYYIDQAFQGPGKILVLVVYHIEFSFYLLIGEEDSL